MPTLSCVACCTVVLLAPVCRCFSHVSCAAVAASGNGRCWAGALNPLSSSPGCCFPFAAASSVGVLHWAQWLHRCAVPHPLIAVLSEREKKEEKAKSKKTGKKEAVAEKGRRKQGVPKWKVRMSLLPSSSKQKQRKATDKDNGRKKKKKRGRQVSCCRQRRRVAEKHTALSHIHTFFTGKGKRGGDGGTLTLSLFPCSFPPLPSFSPGWLAQQWIVKTKGSWHSLSLTRYT